MKTLTKQQEIDDLIDEALELTYERLGYAAQRDINVWLSIQEQIERKWRRIRELRGKK